MNNVLVVDDEQVVLQSCQRILSPEGYEVDTSTSAADALGMLGNKDYGLVITDMKMPGMDGLEFIRQVKTKSPDMNIVLITGYPSQESLS
jgi:DNA-binding NtrC family response regulator